MAETRTPYRWLTAGDISGFLGLMFDNLSVLSFLAGILVIGFQFPAEVVFARMFPGTALGVLVGDLVYTRMAFRLARRTGRSDVTAMLLGLDTPSTLGLALAVLGPAFVSLKASGLNPHDAASATWAIGMATMVVIGLVKLALSFCGGWIQRVVPQAGLLGSLAGIGLALIGLIPLVEIFGAPLVGMIALGLILATLVARVRLPFGVPGVLAAVVLGTALYHFLGLTGLASSAYTPPSGTLHVVLPWPTLAFLGGLGGALKYLPLAIPFGLLTVVGGINNTESARVAGDTYRTRDILLAEAVATLVAGLCGGVAQTTPYIGHPAYKSMGARAGYTLLTGLFVGLGGVLGYVSFIIELIPRAVLAPILVFVALEIMAQAFRASPARHAPAVAWAFFPSVARLLTIKLSSPEIVPAERLRDLMTLPGKALPEMLVTTALGNGFILTAMLWAAFLAEMIDRRLKACASYLGLLAVFTFFGVVHSASGDGSLYLPWTLPTAVERAIPYQFAAGYLLMAMMAWLLSLNREAPSPAPS